MTPTTDRPGGAVRLTETTHVAAAEQSEIAALAAAATSADGVNPLDDQVRSELTHGAGHGARHVLVRTGAAGGGSPVVAYSHVVHDGGSASAHLVVLPVERRRGLGTALVEHLVGLLAADGSGERPLLRVWAHGDTEGAKALAAARGFVAVRELLLMRRPTSVAVPSPSYPEGVTVRTFVPGQDDEAWVALNAAAFASHPEQGKLTVDDLRNRMAEPWFDPAGFFLAERDGRFLGSHWTKVHPAHDGASSADRPVGEVYAVGVQPSAQGLGLGKALTLTGLRHLSQRGLSEVMLYVDGDNVAAIGLYKRLGFTTATVDAMYARR